MPFWVEGIMEIFELDIDEIVEYYNNPRNNKDAIKMVAESISEFGFINPICVDKNNVIIAGHSRLKAARLLGIEKVPCIAPDLSDEDARLLRIIDNRSHEYATWDTVKLSEDLKKFDSPIKDIFFKVYEDRRGRIECPVLSFGKVRLEISREDSDDFDQRLTQYVDEKHSFVGFINHLLGDRYAENNAN